MMTMMATNHIESYLCQLGHHDHHNNDDEKYTGRSINKASKNDIEGEREQALVDQWVASHHHHHWAQAGLQLAGPRWIVGVIH